MTQAPTARTALVAGPTGAIGAALLRRLLADARYGSVKAISRRPLGIVHTKLVELRLDDTGPALLGAKLTAEDVFCCLGTTQKIAGSRAAFERVDYHLVLELARAALAQGAEQFLVVSSVGASLKAASFYLRVKARMEQAVQELGYPGVHVFRPSLLLTERQDSRPGEWLAQKAAPLLNPLLRGRLGIYRAVPVETVAEAMVTLALRRLPGAHTHHLPLAS